MNHPNQITFIDDLIKEDRDITIRMYLEAVQEIDIIEKTCIDMPYEKITPEQEQKILDLAHTGDYKLIQQEAKVGLRTLYKYLKKAELNLKEIRAENKALDIQREAEERTAIIKARQDPTIVPDPPSRSRRPSAIYSNTSPWGVATSLHNQKTA